MRRWAMILVLFAAGCSNAPLADFLDTVAPARIRPEYRDGLESPAPVGPPPPAGTLLPPIAAPQGPRSAPLAPPADLPRLPPVSSPAPFAPAPSGPPNT